MARVGSNASGRTRRVLHVCESTAGGVGVFIVGLAAHQVERGDSVAVAAPSEGPAISQIAEAGARHLPWEAVAQPGPTVPRELWSLRAHVRDFDPDIVHLHSSKAGLIGRMLIRGRRPTVMQPHAWSFFAKTGLVRYATLAWERFGARWADVILCVSDDERRLGQRDGVRADYRVAPNGVDLDRFGPPSSAARNQARALLGLRPGPIAVCVGRLHRQKNQGALLDAWPGVRARVPDARLVLVGEGPDREVLEARSVEGVHFAGQVGDVRPWLDAASVVVQPSRWEGMSLAVLEAMASARAVVATDVSGMREVVEGAGALVAVDDPPALTEAIVERLEDPGHADAEGWVGRTRVEADHELAHQLRDIDALYDELPPAEARGAQARRLRVLVVQPYAEPGGTESWLLRLLDATDELDPEFLLLRDGPFRKKLEQRGIAVDLDLVGTRPWSVLLPIARLIGRLRADPPDVVLCTVSKGALVAGPAAQIAGVPVVWAKHDHGYDRTLARALGRLSTRVIGAAEEVAAPTGRRDAVIIPPPRPEEEPAGRDEARAALAELGRLLDERPTVVVAGRLVPFKGVDDAIAALALPPAADWRLFVAGVDDHASPGETDRLRRLALELGVAERVEFAGYVPDVAHWFAAFDALALLTRPGERRAPDREGFGGTAFEAMLAGIPVITVAGGAAARRLEGRAGISVPPASPGAVADALGRLSDPTVRAAAGEAGRQLVAGHPTASQCAELLVDVLADAAATSGSIRRHGSGGPTRRRTESPSGP